MKGEAVAWLVTGGRTFVDRAFISKKHAENSVAERKDGAMVVPLYTAPQAECAPRADIEDAQQKYFKQGFNEGRECGQKEYSLRADAEKDAARFRKFVEIRSYYIWSECSPEEVEKIIDDYIARDIP